MIFLRTTAGILLLAALAGLALSPSVQAHVGAAEELFERSEIILAPYENAPAVVLDGVIGSLEYNPYGNWMDADSAFIAYFLRGNDSLFVALHNPGPGWVALGFSMDPAEGMTFVVAGSANGTFSVQEQTALDVSDEMTFSPPEAPGAGTIDAANISEQNGTLTAELQLSLNSSLWTLEPGVLVPTVIGFNLTSAGFPTDVAGPEVHFLRTYLSRVQDDPLEISQLFASNISPIPGLIAVAVTTLGVAVVVASFTRRREVR